MKIPPAFALVTATVLAFSTAAKAQSAPLVFKAQNAIVEGGKILLPDTAKTYEFESSGDQGVTLGGKPTMGEDEKSLVFSGLQKKAFCTTKPVPRAKSSINVEMSLFLSPEAVATKSNGTILKHANWEIRCDAQGKQVIAVLWHRSKIPYSQMAVPIKSGEWQRVSVRFESGILTVDVNGSAQQIQVAEKLHYPKQAYSNLLLGANTAEIGNLNLESFRPFTGALADLKIDLDVP
jgi:hypothetical protein